MYLYAVEPQDTLKYGHLDKQDTIAVPQNHICVPFDP